MTVSIADALNTYVQIRDKIAEIETKVKEEKAELKGHLTQIEDFLKAKQKEMGTDSLKAGGITAFKTIKDSVKIDDKEAFKLALATQMANQLAGVGALSEHALAVETLANSDAFDLLTLSANKTNCKAFMADHEGIMPNGLSYFKEDVIQVRKGR